MFALWQVRQNPDCTCRVSVRIGDVYMLVFSVVPSGSTIVLSTYTGRSKPPFTKLAADSSPLNKGLTLRYPDFTALWSSSY